VDEEGAVQPWEGARHRTAAEHHGTSGGVACRVLTNHANTIALPVIGLVNLTPQLLTFHRSLTLPYANLVLESLLYIAPDR
jgi:hypothetical protein